MVIRRFSLHPLQIGLAIGTGLLTQHIFLRLLRLERVGYRSALISTLGVSLLLRSETLWAHPLAAFLAMSSKFLIRYRNKHIFNPTNFGVVIALLFPATWMTPSQWGLHFLMAAWCVMLGALVVQRAQRNDISWSFLLIYLSLIALRVLLKTGEWRVWLNQLNGGLLIFTFFMISDPMTTPNRRGARIFFAALVAVGAYLLQYEFYRFSAQLWDHSRTRLTSAAMAYSYHAQGLLLALFLASPLVPVIDRFFPRPVYDWRKPEV